MLGPFALALAARSGTAGANSRTKCGHARGDEVTRTLQPIGACRGALFRPAPLHTPHRCLYRAVNALMVAGHVAVQAQQAVFPPAAHKAPDSTPAVLSAAPAHALQVCTLHPLPEARHKRGRQLRC